MAPVFVGRGLAAGSETATIGASVAMSMAASAATPLVRLPGAKWCSFRQPSHHALVTSGFASPSRDGFAFLRVEGSLVLSGSSRKEYVACVVICPVTTDAPESGNGRETVTCGS